MLKEEETNWIEAVGERGLNLYFNLMLSYMLVLFCYPPRALVGRAGIKSHK